MFGTPQADFGALLLGDPVPASAVAVGDRMRADWTDFAAGRRPAGWSRYEPQTRPARVYDEPVSGQPYPEETSRRLWAEHRFASLPLL